jgi:23S rRNA (pseudouridine1915-N3)-methyltransferase
LENFVVKLVLASISARKSGSKSDAADALYQEFLKRASRYAPCESMVFESEGRLLETVERRPNQPRATLLLFDSTGELLTSTDFATALGRLRDAGAQRVVLAIGPADGWSAAALARADRVVSLGRMTLPHELARVVMAEQVYRALTILAGHPYHSGH